MKINNKEYKFSESYTLEKIKDELNIEAYSALVDNRLRELTFIPKENSNIEFLDLSNIDSSKIYQATLRYVIAMALKNVYPDENIRFSNSISMGIFAKIIGKNINKEMLKNIKNEVDRLIELNLPLERKKYSIEEMTKYYNDLGYKDKIETLKYRTENVNVYECDGYRNYMYSYMLPSTGYLKSYKFEMYYPGFMVLYPRSEASGLIPEFKDEPNFIRALANANNWSMLTESENIYEINERCKDEEELKKFIFMCEARHDHQLYELGNKIESNIDKIRLIAIAGPSSSGKTTFSKRLEIELLSRNIHPIRISLDNYYKEGGIAPIGIDGKPDYEHIDSLDVDLFNQDMSDFLDGLPVSLPIYNFKDKSRTFSKPLTLKKDNVIIIEGIHALNDKMTKSIPFDAKFKIYIVPLAQRNIDNHSPISLTDLRLLRRIVRDKNFRFTSALETLESWPSVRRGEYKWIYPYMENADFIFNSELGYEILALKKYAFESLKEIDKMSPEYINANSLLKFLKVYRSIDDDLIPNSSLIREFIGKSVFSD